MNEKTLNTLEYYKIVELLEDRAESELGKEKVRAIKPLKNIFEIEKLQRETEEAYKLLVKRTSPPLFGIYNLDNQIKRLEIGGVLEPGDLLMVSDSLRVSRALKSFIKDDEGDRESSYPILEEKIHSLRTFKRIEDEINRVIVSPEEISDNASSNLRSIRKNKIGKNNQIRKKLDSITNSNAYSKYLQDNIVTVRDGRFVVPVKQEYKSNLPGIVHDMSSSGATVFIEPMAVVDLNNELRELGVREKEEIQIILEKLSNVIYKEVEHIARNQKVLQDLDFIFAKGKLALDMDASRPILNTKGYINMKDARHPLLDKEEVVPIDVYLGDEFTSLVITGPNTGGKTVTLKTIGLLIAMAQSGIHIPAAYNSELAVFQQIFADIGDEQSIEQSLSTFSSHMTNIVDILENVDEDSLVLFDELGAGTDPTEGAALAMSILDHLLKREIATIATTHYSQLKVYALTTENVTNASVEFDVETLSPTYKLLIGVPGKSNAFEISHRLGLPDYIIDDAKNFISQENVKFEDVLQAMDKDRKEAEEHRVRAESQRMEVERLKEELARKESQTEEMRNKILTQARQEARDILRNAKSEADQIVDDLRNISTDIEKERNKKIQEGREKLKGSLDQVESELSADVLTVKSNKPPENLKVGETVKVLTFDQIGEVLTEPDANGDVQVQVGIMRITSNVDSLKRTKSEEEEAVKTKTRHIMSNKAKSVDSEIDLRGLALDEAILEVDKYLDDAYMAGLNEVEIIHGKGSGILRDGITGYLRTHSHVKSHRLGKFNEGGDGVTIAKLK